MKSPELELRFHVGLPAPGRADIRASLLRPHGLGAIEQVLALRSVDVDAWLLFEPNCRDLLWQWSTDLHADTLDHPHSPVNVHHDDVARVWAALLSDLLLRDVLGPGTFPAILSDAGSWLRLVVTADGAATRLPYELLQWPPRDSAARLVTRSDAPRVSVVRQADSSTRAEASQAPLAREGQFRPLAICAPAGLEAGPATQDRALREVLEPFQRSGVPPPRTLRPYRPVQHFAGDGRHLQRHLEVSPELLVLFGHGTTGADRDGWVTGSDGSRVDGAALGEAVATARVNATVLAMCHSATATGASVSPAEETCRRSGALTVGFAGETPVNQTVHFLRGFGDSLARTLSSEGTAWTASLDLLEQAVACGRDAMGDSDAHLPVVHAPAQAFTGRRPVIRVRPRAATEIPWATIGQLLVFAVDETAYRIPVPVDPGYRIASEFSEGSIRLKGLRHGALLTPLLRNWEAASGRTVEVVPSDPEQVMLSSPAGEMCAVGRIAEAVGLPFTDDIWDQLRKRLGDEWAAEDGAPRVVECHTGLSVRRLARAWPELWCEPLECPMATANLEGLEPPVEHARAGVDIEWSDVESAFTSGPSALISLAHGQRHRWLDIARQLQKDVGQELSKSRSAPAIAVPDAGVLWTTSGVGRLPVGRDTRQG